jgi:hypothetical protein
MSTGPSHPRIPLLACEYRTPNQESLLISDVNSKSNDHMQTFATVVTLPYGLRNYSVDRLKEMCQEHIEAISTEANIIGDPSSLKCKLLQVICHFQESDPIAKRACIYLPSGFLRKMLIMMQNNLLRKAIMVNRLHYAKAQLLTFSEDSASEALKNLQNPPAIPLPPNLSARMMNRQIKGGFHLVLEDLQPKVIDDFDWELRHKRKDTWALCLCTFLVLCLCVEEIQVAVDGFAQYKISNEGGNPTLIRQFATEICRRLEKETLGHTWYLLTGKMDGLKRHNPFRYGFSADDKSTRSVSEIKLVNDLRQIMSDHGNWLP